MKNRAGFTLVELMVVVCIVGIVAGAAGPAVITYLNDRGVADAANDLLANLHKIRSRAIKERANATITFDQDTNQYQAVLTDPSTAAITTLAPVNFNSFRGEVSMTAASVGQITFNNRGASPVSGSVILSNNGNSRSYRLRTTLAGGISIHVLNHTTGQWVSL